jgi:chromosome segregation ATPase
MFQYMIGIGIIVLITIIVHPFWRNSFHEPFQDEMKIEVKFEGARWTTEELEEFQRRIQNSKPSLEQSQNELHTILEDYKRVMRDMENSAYKQKQSLDDIPSGQRAQVVKSSGISETPVKDFYNPLLQAKKDGFSPIITRTEHDLRRSLPRVSIPPLGAFANEEGLSWIHRGETKERYDAEENFYKIVPVYLPEFLASVNEVLKNARILRENAGEQSWAMRPRVEQMEARAKEAEKKANEGNEEGFKDQSCPKSIRVRIIQTIPYSKWGAMAKEISEKLSEIQDLNRKSKEDIQEAERILQGLQSKGAQGKRKAQNAV